MYKRQVEYCPAGAVKLGQKLCTQNGPVEYPRQELPDAVKWGPEKWDVDYRDNNRINCYDAGTAPCKTACPAHIAVQGYLKMAAQGRYTDALALIKKENPFPAAVSYTHLDVYKRQTEDLVGPAVFLASDASNFVNGHVLYVDGGILAYIGKQPQ